MTSLENAFERIVTAFASVNRALNTIMVQNSRHHEQSREDGSRREREFELLRHALVDLKHSLIVLSGQLTEARSDLKDITPPLGVKLPPRDSNGFAIDETTIKVPKTWLVAALPVLKWVALAVLAASGWIASLVRHGP
jgi:hypothetical protein